MGRKATGRPSGRPRIFMDWKMIDKLLQSGCNGVEVASALGCHPNTLYERCAVEHNMSFYEYSRLKKAVGNLLIKVSQFEAAVQGNTTMLIWLGKQRLGQSNHIVQTEALIRQFTIVNYSAEENEALS